MTLEKYSPAGNHAPLEGADAEIDMPIATGAVPPPAFYPDLGEYRV